MKKLQIFLIFFSSFISLNAQEDTTKNKTYNDPIRRNIAQRIGARREFTVFDERYDGVKGNRFFYDDKYHEGELWLNKDRHFTNEYQYKFDQLENTVQVIQKNGKEILLDIKDIEEFHLHVEDKSIIFTKVTHPETGVDFLVQAIYSSPTLQLLRQVSKKLQRVKNTGAYSAGEVYDDIIKDFHYFVTRGDNKPLKEVKMTKKSLAKALPHLEKKIETLFNSSDYKGDLTVSKAAELMKKLDEYQQKKMEDK